MSSISPLSHTTLQSKNKTVTIANGKNDSNRAEKQTTAGVKNEVTDMAQKLAMAQPQPVKNELSEQQAQQLAAENARKMFQAHGGISAEFVSSLLDRNPYTGEIEK